MVRAFGPALCLLLAAGPARAELLHCIATRICYDPRPCAAVENPEKDYCRERLACDALSAESLTFVIDLPAEGARALVQLPAAPEAEALVLSRFLSPYSADPAEQITLSLLPQSDDQPPNRRLISLDLARNRGRAEAVLVELSTDVERGTVTTYGSCDAQ